MKEKIIDFSNGIFTYEQVRLRTEPEALYLRSEEGRTVKGSFIINSLDERRVSSLYGTAGTSVSEDGIFWKSIPDRI